MGTTAYTQAAQKKHADAEIIGQKRQEKALREFKKVLNDLVFMLRCASGMETVYLYWVNRNRRQFVMETKSTILNNVMFQDRVGFEDHFLNTYKDLDEPLNLQIDKDLPADALKHYYDEIPVKYITLLPFLNNGETVAITVLESRDHIFTDMNSEIIYSYIDALRNVLNTYLEISDLYENQEEWVDYEEQLSNLNTRGHRAELAVRVVENMQRLIPTGGVSLIAQGMNGWANVYNAQQAKNPPPLGIPLEERTLVHEALQNGKPEFSIHFNNNPKRISPREKLTEGATLAIPLLLKDRRQGVVMVYDENPLIFKESMKHKLINFVRLAGLKIMANEPGLDVDEPIFTNEYQAFLPDLWEQIIDTQIERLKTVQNTHTWMGLISPSNLPGLRTALRLEDLQTMQKDLVSLFNPGRFGIPGLIGFNTDYVYAFIIQSNNSNAVKHWASMLKKELQEPLELTNGQQIETDIKIGYVLLNTDQQDSYQVIGNAKAALNQAMKKNGETGS